MLGKKFAVPLLAVVLAGIGPARAAAPELPAKAIGSDSIVVVHMDAATLTPDALRQAAKAVLGDQAAGANAQIDKFQARYDKAVKAGVQSMTFVGHMDPSPDKTAEEKPDAANKEKSQGVAYIRLKAGADASAVQKMLTDEMEADQKGKMVFNREGNFLVMHETGEKMNAAADAARSRQFMEAVTQSSGAGMVIAFVPNQAVRDKHLKDQADAPPFLKQATPVVLNSKWVALAINIGNTPAITVTDNAADDASARQLVEGINTGLVQLKQLAQQMQNGQGGAGGGGNPMAMMFAPLLAPMADALKPAQAGSKVTVTLQGQPLTMIAQTAMQFGAMFNMGGRGAGPGPGAGPARGIPQQ